MDEVFDKKTGITTLNLGVSGSATTHQFYWLKSKYRDSYNTKLIVLGFCLNDFSQNLYLRYFDPSLGNWFLYKYLSGTEGKEVNSRDASRKKEGRIIEKWRLGMFVYHSIRSIQTRQDELPPLRINQVTKEQEYFTELYIKKIREFSERIGSEFVVVLFPTESQLRYTYASHERMQDALIRILERNGIRYVDLYDVMKANYQRRPDVRWFHDDAHPYKEGHRLIGEYLARELPKMFPRVFE